MVEIYSFGSGEIPLAVNCQNIVLGVNFKHLISRDNLSGRSLGERQTGRTSRKITVSNREGKKQKKMPC